MKNLNHTVYELNLATTLGVSPCYIVDVNGVRPGDLILQAFLEDHFGLKSVIKVDGEYIETFSFEKLEELCDYSVNECSKKIINICAEKTSKLVLTSETELTEKNLEALYKVHEEHRLQKEFIADSHSVLNYMKKNKDDKELMDILMSKFL